MPRDVITCHVLDTVSGKPAAAINCTLSIVDESFNARIIATGKTDNDGRIINWAEGSNISEATTEDGKVKPARYKVKFDTGEYLSKSSENEIPFFPFVEVVFTAPSPPEDHYHIPLLLSNYSYSTYRGS